MRTSFDELKLTGRLPSPAGVGMQILRLTQREDFSAEELARTIEADPALTGRVVKMANSALHGGRGQVKTVRDAVVRIGAAAVRGVALGFSLISSHKRGACAAFDYDLYWSESLARAVAGQVLASRHQVAQQAESFTLGLLSGIGRLALASVHPEEYARMLASLGGVCFEPGRLAEAEREAFGIDHFEVARCMFEDWKLPEAYGEAVVRYRDEEIEPENLPRAAGQLVRALRFATACADLFVRPPERAGPSLEALRREARTLELADADLAAGFDAAAIEWRKWGDTLGVRTRELPLFAELVGCIAESGGEAPRRPAAASVEPAATATRSPDPDRLRVLVVEDDELTRRLLARRLEQAGYEVTECADGEEALRTALEDMPHIVLCDWNLPSMSGLEICRSLRQTEDGTEVYFVLLTGQQSEEDQVAGLEAGANDFLVKPVAEKILLSRVAAGARLVRLREKERRQEETIRRQLAEMSVMNRKLRNAMVTDVLTDLPNRRGAIDRLQEQWDRRDPARKESLAVVMVDIDHFKQVNDTYGHDAGDAVLREVAAVFRKHLRRDDVVCRLGGEEFVVICPGSDVEGAAKVAERLRSAVEAHEIVCEGFRGRVTCSFGVAERTPEMKSQDDLIKAADVALYEAKRSGRNRVCVHRPEKAHA